MGTLGVGAKGLGKRGTGGTGWHKGALGMGTRGWGQGDGNKGVAQGDGNKGDTGWHKWDAEDGDKGMGTRGTRDGRKGTRDGTRGTQGTGGQLPGGQKQRGRGAGRRDSRAEHSPVDMLPAGRRRKSGCGDGERRGEGGSERLGRDGGVPRAGAVGVLLGQQLSLPSPMGRSRSPAERWGTRGGEAEAALPLSLALKPKIYPTGTALPGFCGFRSWGARLPRPSPTWLPAVTRGDTG